jgi:hypothetical protein
MKQIPIAGVHGRNVGETGEKWIVLGWPIDEVEIRQEISKVIQFARYPLPVVQVWFSTKWFFQSVWRKNRFFNIDGDRDIQTLNQWVLKEKPAKWIEKFANKFSRTNQIHSRLWIKIKTEIFGFCWFKPIDRRPIQTTKEIWNISVHPFAKTTRNTNRRHHDVFFYDDTNYFVFSKDSNADQLIESPNGTQDRCVPRNHSSRQHPIKE